MAVTLALAGDTMLGRRVAETLAAVPPTALFADEVAALTRDADLFVLNLECCVSTRGEPWPDPDKPFYFRAPPVAVDALTHLGVDAVTLANNHALDYGPTALADTLRHLASAGIACVGAGADAHTARRPAILEAGGLRLGVIGVSDHPADFAAGPDRPGIAYADLRRGVPDWLSQQIAEVDSDALLVAPHWGPNMVAAPVPHVRAAVTALGEAGVSLLAGHSAHVVHGAQLWPRPVLYDLGDFIDDYAVHPELRNDLGLLWLVRLDGANVVGVEAVPLALDFCHTRLANSEEAAWLATRLAAASGEFGTTVTAREDRLVLGTAGTTG